MTGRKLHRDWIKYLVALKLVYTLSQHLVTQVRTAAGAKLCIYLTSCYLQLPTHQPICNAAQVLSLWHSLLVQVFSLVVALVIEHLRFRTFAPGTKRVVSRTNTRSFDCPAAPLTSINLPNKHRLKKSKSLICTCGNRYNRRPQQRSCCP